MLDLGGLEGRVLDHIRAAAIAIDGAGTVTLWNSEASSLAGVPREEALGRDVRTVLDGDGLRAIAAALGAERPAEEEVAYHDPEGRERLCLVRVSPLPDGGAVALAVEISDRLRVERRLRAQYAAATVLAKASEIDEATRAILRGVGEAIGWDAGDVWVVDEDEEVLRFVDLWAGEGIRGEALAEAGRRFAFSPGEGLPGRVWASHEPQWIADVLDDGNFPRASLGVEAGVRSAFAFPIRHGGRVLGVMEFFHRLPTVPDKTLLEAMNAVGKQFGQFLERVAANEAVEHSDALKTAILEAAADAIITIDHDGRVMEWNPGAEAAFGYTREEVVGRELAELIVPDELRHRHREGVRRVVETGRARILGTPMEFVARRKDGTGFPVEATIQRAHLPGPPVFTGYVRDVTETKQAEARLVEGERRLEQALEAGNMGAWEWDVVSGRVEWSPTLERLHGREEGTFPGTLEAFHGDIHADDRPHVLQAIEQALEGTEPYRVEYRVLRRDGSQRWIEAIGEVRRTPDGRPMRMHGVCMDVTARREAEEVRSRLLEGEQAARAQAEEARSRLAFLAEASRILGSSLRYEKTLARVAQLAVPEMADWCSVDMTEDGSIRQVALAHADRVAGEVARRILERYPPDLDAPGGIGEVLRTGEALLHAEISPALLDRVARDAEHRRLLEELELRSAMIVPLVARGKTLGTMTFASGPSGRRFGRMDLALAQELADRAAVAIDNARLYEDRSSIARSLQRSLLPPALPEIPGVEVAARYQPAGEGFQVGGDFYDVYQRGTNEWTLVIGDVCGKGPEAAAVTGLARHALRAASINEESPGACLRLLNEAILQDGTDRFCTVAKGRLVPEGEGATLTVACGGHHLPYVLRADGRLESVGEHGTLLGMFPEISINDQTVRLGRGDAVIFYTDGVIEDRDPDRTRPPRSLPDLLGSVPADSAEAIADHIEAEVGRANPSGPQDDVALVVARVTA